MGQALSANDTRLLPSRFEAGEIIRAFLRWAHAAPAGARAEGAAALAMAYLRGDLDPADRNDALSAMTALLDDASPLVRLALAKVLAPASGAPHHIVTALAGDRADIAALVLGVSPVLTEAELIDALALGGVVAQTAIARRPDLSVGIAAAVAEVGASEACAALCENPRAPLTRWILSRLLERFGDDASLREAVLARPDLDAALRHDLVVATGRALAQFVTEQAWMTPDVAARVVREASDQACITIAAEIGENGTASGAYRLAAHLRDTGRLTSALILRALLCGNLVFAEAAMSELSGLSPARVAGLMRAGRQSGFGALYAKAGLPAPLLPVFRAAVGDLAATRADARGMVLQRHRIAKVLMACESTSGADLGKVTALLRRFDAEAAREDARVFAFEVRRERSETVAEIAPFVSVDLGYRSAA